MTKGLPPLDFEKEAERIAAFIRKVVGSASADGVVVALSGGVDSAVAGALCVKALGPEKVLALLLPSHHTPKMDQEDASALAKTWGVRAVRIPISGITQSLTKEAKLDGSRIARANLEARTRMMMLYYYANTLSYLVAGTGDRSEIWLGYYTKWGDGGADFLPLAHLYKTQVRAMGAHLGVPRSVVEKPASPQLWSGQKASDELPADYDALDIIIHQLADLGATPSEAARASGVTEEIVVKAIEMNRRSAHKRSMPPSLT